jgi:hypothetical protein
VAEGAGTGAGAGATGEGAGAGGIGPPPWADAKPQVSDIIEKVAPTNKSLISIDLIGFCMSSS